MNTNEATKKKLAWFLSFVLIITSIATSSITASAEGPTELNDGEDGNIITAGTQVKDSHDNTDSIDITYYASKESQTVLVEDMVKPNCITMRNECMRLKPYAWHVEFVKRIDDVGCGERRAYYKAYPATSVENLPSTDKCDLCFPEGTVITGDNMSIDIYAGDTQIAGGIKAAGSYTLLSGQQIKEAYQQQIPDNYNMPDITQLFYKVENLNKNNTDTDKVPHIKLTLISPVEVSFNTEPGTLNSNESNVNKYAISNARLIDSMMPKASLEGKDFYGWKNKNGKYVYIQEEKNLELNVEIAPFVHEDDNGINKSTLTAMYCEKAPEFIVDTDKKLITNLLPNRKYLNGSWHFEGFNVIHNKFTPQNGNISYDGWESNCQKISLMPETIEESYVLRSPYVKFKYDTPKAPELKATATKIIITNPEDYEGCEFGISKTESEDGLRYGTTTRFSELDSDTDYYIYVRHKKDKRLASDSIHTAARTSTVKKVSDDTPNDVSIEAIPDQCYTGSALEPELTVKDGENTLVKDEDYTVSYKNNSKAGTGTAEVTFWGSESYNDCYKGSLTKEFNIYSIKKVSVTPSAVRLAMGKNITQSFTASVDGENNPPQDVTWSVDGKTSTKTAISSRGVLTVGEDETSTSLTVRAESIYDSSKYGTVTVAIHYHNTEIRNAKAATAEEEGYTGDTYCKDCNEKLAEGKVIPKLKPSIINGEGSKVTADGKASASFRSSASITDFLKVMVDGIEVPENMRTVTKGSTIVELKPEYIAALTPGEHTLEIVSTTGTAATTFTVEKQQDSTSKEQGNENNSQDNTSKAPKTGDNSSAAVWIVLMAVLAIAAVVLYARRRRLSK